MKRSKAKKISKTLLVEHIARLMKIFNSKKWPICDEEYDDDVISGEDSKSLFVDFCYSLSKLEPDEQELMLDLTEDYLRYSYMDYPVLMSKTLRLVDKDLLAKSDRIFLLPLVSPKDRSKGVTKSAHGILYQIMHDIIPKDPNFGPIKKRIVPLNDISALNTHYANRKNALLLFFDDFIGTGNTACEALWDYWSSYRIEGDTVAILAFVAQEIGRSLLRQHHFIIYALNVRKRGISDSLKFTDVGTPLSIMDRIERKIRVSIDYRRGYGKCEALVTMLRTPNNTFPVYWWSKSKSRKGWSAPFSR